MNKILFFVFILIAIDRIKSYSLGPIYQTFYCEIDQLDSSKSAFKEFQVKDYMTCLKECGKRNYSIARFDFEKDKCYLADQNNFILSTNLSKTSNIFIKENNK